MSGKYMLDFTAWQEAHEQYQQYLWDAKRLIVCIVLSIIAMMASIVIAHALAKLLDLRNGTYKFIIVPVLIIGTIASSAIVKTASYKNPEPYPDGFSATMEKIYGLDSFQLQTDGWVQADAKADRKLPQFTYYTTVWTATWIDGDGTVKDGYVKCSADSKTVIGLAEKTKHGYRMVEPIHSAKWVKLPASSDDVLKQ